MMSADNENQSVATCMNSGAKNYFVKPVRAQTLKSLWKYIDLAKIPNSPVSDSVTQFDILMNIGGGASGTAYLIRSKKDGQLYALKKIPLRMKSQQERKLAENEFSLLKVLDSPTIIHYYEHFVDNDETINIIMEYAEGGSLAKKIKDHKITGEYFTNEEILDWIAQLVLGMCHMHSKNILHRDIKPDNIFLSKDHVAKLGDFGVSKALTLSQSADTFCGTPFYMSPEVCGHESYNKQSDVWALGCSIYEMATLDRPFGKDQDDLQGLFRCIRDKEVDPLPERIDPKISDDGFLCVAEDAGHRVQVFRYE
jgi:NIMA (never in mitosis gene a)-related kinase